MKVYRWWCELQWTLITLEVPAVIDELHESAGWLLDLTTAGMEMAAIGLGHRGSAPNLLNEWTSLAQGPSIGHSLF